MWQRRSKLAEYHWRYIRNLQSTISFRSDNIPLTAIEQGILSDLNNTGIATAHISSLIDNGPEILSKCQNFAFARLAERKSEVAQIEDRIANPGTEASLDYLELLEPQDLDTPDSPFIEFALNKALIKIADAYLGLRSQLRYMNVWHSVPSPSRGSSSHYWHRDEEDFLILNAYLYLSTVDDGTGAFTYAKGTHPKKYRSPEPNTFKIEGHSKILVADDELNRSVPQANQFVAVGPPGTVVFADTSGLHRGGHCTKGSRTKLSALFTSKTAITPDPR